MRLRTGFSLVELMIVVAIIGVLAAIAIPNYIGLQLRAKRAELPTNVDGIKTAELGYDAAHDGFVACSAHPSPVPVKTVVEWGFPTGGFDSIGWRPDGMVRGQYAVELDETGEDFTVIAQSDIDGDGNYADVRATSLTQATLTTGNDAF